MASKSSSMESQIEFVSSPFSFQQLTESLTLKCVVHALKDVSSTGAAQDSSKTKFITSIIISKDDQTIANVTVRTPARLHDSPGGARVSGQIKEHDGKLAFLKVVWDKPGPHQVGTYVCTVGVMDDIGLLQHFTKTVEVTKKELTLNDVVAFVQTQEATIKEQADTIVALGDTVHNLKKQNEKQSASLLEQANKIAELEYKNATQFLFTAGLSKNVSLTYNEVLVFDQLLHNQGGGYSTDSGIFVCKIGGHYLFQVHALSECGRSLSLGICHNDKGLVQLHTTGNGYQVTSNCVSVKLFKGDKVMVKAFSDSHVFGHFRPVTIFSGQLVA